MPSDSLYDIAAYINGMKVIRYGKREYRSKKSDGNKPSYVGSYMVRVTSPFNNFIL